MGPHENFFCSFAGGSFEVADEWEDEGVVEVDEIHHGCALEEHHEIMPASGFEPLQVIEVHEKHRLELYFLVIVIPMEAKYGCYIDYSHAEEGADDAEFSGCVEDCVEVGHAEIPPVEDYHENAYDDASCLS